MTYSIQFRQICTICRDEDKLISTRAESASSTVQSNHKITIGKVLKCGHAFHTVCINRHFYDNHKNCPTCRAPVAEEDSEYDLTEDPAPPEGYSRYYSSSKDETYLYMMPSNVPPEMRPEILERMKRMSEEALNNKSTSFSFIPLRRSHAPANPSPPIFMDLNGVGHQNL